MRSKNANHSTATFGKMVTVPKFGLLLYWKLPEKKKHAEESWTACVDGSM
jgi:hypothetical protein